MTLTPYLKLMLEKNADSLSLKSGSPALLGLAGEEYPLGKNELNSNIIKEITFSLIDDVQKQELVRNKALEFNCTAPDGEKFLANAKVEDNGLVLLSFRIRRRQKPSPKSRKRPAIKFWAQRRKTI